MEERERERESDQTVIELYLTYIIDLCTAKPDSTGIQSAVTEKAYKQNHYLNI